MPLTDVGKCEPLGQSGRALNVLRVEAEDRAADVVAALSVENGHHVTHAANAPEALALLKKQFGRR